MIPALSALEVANGLDVSVANASLNRPWHASEAHHASHKGIPKGLKLDPAFTQLIVMESLCD